MSYAHKAVQMEATIATMLLLRDEVTLNDSSEGNLIYCIVVARGPIDSSLKLHRRNAYHLIELDILKTGIALTTPTTNETWKRH